MYDQASAVSDWWNSTLPASRLINTNDLMSSGSSGTLTIINENPNAMVHMLLPSAELVGAEGDLDEEIVLLRKAVWAQDQLQDDEPSPIFYQILETLAGALMKRGGEDDIEEAIRALRSELFAWRRSSLATLALAQTLQMQSSDEAPGTEIVLSEALTLNDTVLDLASLQPSTIVKIRVFLSPCMVWRPPPSSSPQRISPTCYRNVNSITWTLRATGAVVTPSSAIDIDARGAAISISAKLVFAPLWRLESPFRSSWARTCQRHQRQGAVARTG